MTATQPIPKEALRQHIIALGKTGSGKSSKLRVLVEALLSIDAPVCIVDPKGDWWGLKSSADGKESGFPIVIFGGEHADVPINEHSGAHIAELVATGNRSALIDLGGWMVGERTRFFIDFASTLFKLTRGTRTLVFPEVHNFAPKGKILDPSAGRALHWANRLASEGRGKGLTILADSQRPQKVHNDFLTSCETLIACRVIHKADRDAIKDWIDGCADAIAGKQVLAELAQMKRTDAWVWSPEIEFGPERITWPMFKTYDSFKPQAADTGKLKGWAEVNLDEVRAKLASVVEEQKANDPTELKKRIRELERQVATGGGKTDADIIDARRTGERDGFNKGASHGYRRGWDEHARALQAAIASIPSGPPDLGDNTESQTAITAASRPAPIRAPAAPATPRLNGTAALPRGEAATLTACIQFPDGLRREQLTVLTGYKRSSRDAYIQRLKERGLVTVGGDRVAATAAGQAALPNAEPLPTGPALQDHWLQRLPEGERRVLSVLIERYPEPVPRADIDDATGYQRSSRDAYLQRLRAKQLVVEPSRGEVRACEDLF